MIDYRNIIRNRELRLKLINLLSFIPDVPYLKMVYRIKTGKKLNIVKPKTYCEKLNWMKLHNIHPEYTQLVDKIAVREIVNKIAGKDICFPLLGTWEKFDDIDFKSLPNQFVLKCNHDSGSVKIIRNKNEIDHNQLRKFYNHHVKRNPFVAGREYPYKNVRPRILAEPIMIPEGDADINDYKFFCFNGKPAIMFVATERNTDVKFDFFDMDFNHLDIYNIHPNSTKTVTKPACFEEMKDLAAKLSKGINHVRVDLYEINGKVYFGEYTFFHGGGFWPFYPEEWEQKLGSWIHL